MHFLELSDYTLSPLGSGSGLSGVYFALSKGDVCTIDTTSPDDAHLFLRALALLTYPVKGSYKFKDAEKDFSNNDEILRCKRKIGYIAPDAALISHLTIRQNLLLSRYYFENNLNLRLGDQLRCLCTDFGIREKLDNRPVSLNSMEVQAAVVIREICKKPEIMILERPEIFFGHARFDLLVRLFIDWMKESLPVVFLSFDRRLIRRYANRKILITNGSLTTVDIKRFSGAE